VSVKADRTYWEDHYYVDQVGEVVGEGKETKYERDAAARVDLAELDRGMSVKSRSLCQQLPSFH
jgi:hypothetical protein